MKPASVLLVEDERIVALNLKRKLISMGYQVPAHAASGHHAMELIEEFEPDVILMDINIEGDIDGIETASRIPEDCQVPVIYLTAYAGDETLDRARETKPYGYLLKPFSDRELHATIQMALERHQFEQKIKESEERLRLAMDAAEMGVWELDVVSRSMHSEGLTGLTEQFSDDVYSGTWEEFMETVYEPDRELVRKVLHWTESDERLCQVDYRRQMKNDGEVIWYRLIGKAFSQRKKPNRILGVIQNITEQKNMESLRQTKDAAVRASKFKSEFLASMSHEVRTPLNGVIGMIDLLQRTPLNEIQASYAKIIHGSGKTLLAVINDILDFSKIEAGKMSLSNQVFDLCECVEEIVSPFRINSSKVVIFVASVAPPTPTELLGDPLRLQQIIGNLLSNAFKFTDSGKISLRITAEPLEKSQLRLKITVSDSGIGIPPEQMEKIFKPFSQVSSSYRRSQGTGLGLVICQRLVQIMEGDMQVTSNPGTGTTFNLNIIMQSAQDLLPKDDVSPLGNLKLLAVDDCQDYLDIISEQAAYLGMQVVTASNSQKAIELAKATKPDFITIDLQIPGETGFELDRQLSTLPEINTIPRILLSTSCIPPDENQFKKTGFVASHVKPISVSQLKSILLSALSGKEAINADKNKSNAPLYPDKHVLVAEDNAVNRQVIKAMLKTFGVNIEIVNDGEQALRKAIDSEAHYDLILMDCQMPIMDGYQATRAIREFERRIEKSPVPIVAVTAHALPEHQGYARDAGMNGYLDKPINLQALASVLERAFSGQ